ncbi:hypothetical protein [Streptomyces durhamensis]|uniref:hypothetical protein n=1 Tax=Streptomyces durhamensis TaxID=68194 RepID=UPI0004CDBA97|nr:hypothetical protein [Streptomyces durhamensis]
MGGRNRAGRVVVDWLTTTDHKKIGHLYPITAFGFFLAGGVMALLMRAELARPGQDGRSLEWATSCPPPRHNFVTLPRIRSESPAFDLHHPQYAGQAPRPGPEPRRAGPGSS